VAWIEAMLRGQKVLARANDEGELVAEGGRVEIRYKPSDGRAYRAAKGNLSITSGAKIFPDDHCASAEAAPSEYQRDKQKKAASKARFDRENADGAKTAPKPHEWVAFTDGACSGNPGPAGAGFVVIEPGGKIREGFEYLGEATNNVAELTAILRGLEGVTDVGAPVRVLTDSSYAIGVLQKGWKAKTNQELIARVKAELSRRPNAHLAYVPGHAGVPMNERADQLAREAVTSRRTKALS
jgi:ribonuclease HI